MPEAQPTSGFGPSRTIRNKPLPRLKPGLDKHVKELAQQLNQQNKGGQLGFEKAEHRRLPKGHAITPILFINLRPPYHSHGIWNACKRVWIGCQRCPKR